MACQDEFDRSADSRPILVAVDGGVGTQPLLRGAARLAELSGASLIVAHVVPRVTPVVPEAVVLQTELRHDVAVSLFAEVVEGLYDCPVACRLVTTTGVAAVQLAQIAKQYRVAAIVVGADAPGLWNRIRRCFTGSVPQRLAHLQSAPVVVLPGACSRTLKVAAAERARREAHGR